MRFTGPFLLDDLAEREWLLTNGLGGYASTTLCGMNTRRYHGLLVAALHPPGQRTLLVAKVEESVLVADEQEYAISTNEYPGIFYPTGFRFLQECTVEAHRVDLHFHAGEAKLMKSVSMVQGENTTCLQYRNTGTVPFSLKLTPLVNARDFHGETTVGGVNFSVHPAQVDGTQQVLVIPDWFPDGYWLCCTRGEWHADETWYHNVVHRSEERRGLHALDNHFSPGHFFVHLAPGEDVSLTLSSEGAREARACSSEAIASSSAQHWGADDPQEIRDLYHTASTFLVKRGDTHSRGRTVIAGYHWFGDWGRDTMIALPGLCLTTKRYGEAADILRTFAAARRRGLLPNLFLDSGEGEAYNTVDAALWFIYAVERYYHATDNHRLIQELRPALEEIIHCYRHGTDYGIAMDDDGLIVAAAPGWQLTWMDAKVGDWVVTPRMGKPVEISALWYNALRVMEQFAWRFQWGGEYGRWAEHVRKNFSAFWNPQSGCLFDVLAETPDASVRPNQIFALSLPYSPLDQSRASEVLAVVTRELLTPYGLRTLAPGEAEYMEFYRGGQWERDGAYHRGTIWPWLLGHYIDAYLRVNNHDATAKAHCRALLQPLLDHLSDAGIGSISEIFEAKPPHRPCGAISQAWSVAEVLRTWEVCRGTG